MSDNRDNLIAQVADEYEERTEEELDALRQAMKQGQILSGNYVAEPVPGSDVPGIFLSYGAHLRSGYAHVGYALSRVLERDLDLPVKLIPHRTLDIALDRVPKEREADVGRWMGAPVGIGKLLVVTMPLIESSYMTGLASRLVTYTTHETDRISKEAAARVFLFEKIWCKSPHAWRAFRRAGVEEERLRLLYPPIVGGPWKCSVRESRGAPVSAERPFRFGFVGQWQPRKGMHDLVRAYYRAFAPDQPVRLELRTSSLFNETVSQLEHRIRHEISEIRSEFAQDTFPPIRVLTGIKLTDQELIDWIGELDAFANPSYGEGTGIPHVYAMAQGVPMVTTLYGAVGDLIRSAYNAEPGKGFCGPHGLVAHRLERISTDMLRINRAYDYEQLWGRYEPADFADAMADVFCLGRQAGEQYLRDPGALIERATTLHGQERAQAELRKLLAEVLPEKYAEEWLR